MASYVVIDSDHYDDAGIETMFFPGGEPHLKFKQDLQSDTLLFLKLRTWTDAGFAALLIDAFVQLGLRHKLFIPYFPGARQDKGIPLTLRVMAKLLASRSKTHIFDGHSAAIGNLALGIVNWMPAHLKIPIKEDVVGIIAPDEGALRRAMSFRNAFYKDADFIQCVKKRNPDTGELSGYEMVTPLRAVGRYIIVDDICDGGGTFNLLAKEFVEKDNERGSKLELFVSHGIFSKGASNVNPIIECITTTDSFYVRYSDPDPRLYLLSLKPLFDKIMEN